MIAIPSQLPMMYRRSRFWDIINGHVPSPVFTTSRAHTINTVPVTVSMDMSLGKVENVGSDYCNALQLLKNIPPEQRLDIHVPYSQYLKLEKSWSEYPCLSYNSLEQIATVVTIQRDIHDLSTRKPQALYTATMMGFDGDHAKSSSKEPDGSFKYWGPRGRNLRIAIEVGFSENCDALRRDKDMWIRGQHVPVVILLHLKESPKFSNPTTAYKNVEDVNVELARMQESMYEATRRSREKGICGPFEYCSHMWFGTLTEAFIEVWRADRKDKAPINYYFFTEDAWAAANFPDSYVLFDGYLYLQRLLAGMGLTAQMRFVDFFRWLSSLSRSSSDG
ncbi:hypothetical protein V1506DRAFT_567743 [Lipomyces tetrasporus]